ncbi:hypothetical protein [Actomonas aquatica]|uniref:Band 7 domain-containing protein n=1 Tax=Actomonas aquatica TaxID=2866162 RepID=A0ABZ1C218_9BACT|nr:hypothetical protein [Opitutus sp. WL0086]WRQ85708.1 hypothetical protein K1X11_012920 [Opitutus sp. WL0086]
MIVPHVIREGERALVWHRSGRATTVDGPRRVWTWGARLQVLEQHLAGPEEYLVVHRADGGIEHRAGPAALWFDPLRHERIEVAPKLKLNANEAIVIYREQDGRVTRRVARGPALFVPAPDEWLHRFSWHGADPRQPRRKVARALQFEKLRVMPDQLYYDVENVRTADDALITVQLMIFFELRDIEEMLDRTHDPIADFINATTADVIDFAAELTFEAFKERTERLNELDTYAQLVRRAELTGYRIGKIVYRGYEASATLQTMHDDAIEARTRLKLEAETERQAQDLADLKQERDGRRKQVQQELAKQELTHRVELETAEHAARRQRDRLAEEQALELRRRAGELDLQQQQATDAQRLAFLTGAADLKVDLTRYLVAQYQHPDRLIRIDGGRKSDAAQLHLHES